MAIYEAPSPTTVRPTGEFEIQSRTEWPTTFFVRKYRDHAADAAGIVEYLYQLRAREKDNLASACRAGKNFAPDGVLDLSPASV